MEIVVVDGPPEAVAADILAIPVTGEPALGGPGSVLDAALGGQLVHLVEDGELKGKAGDVTLVHTQGVLAAHRVAAAGVGKREEIDEDALRTAAARVASRAGALRGGTVAWALDETLPIEVAAQTRAIVDGTVLGGYDPGRWKTRGERALPLERLSLVGPAAAAAEPARRAGIAARWANRCRELVDAPANELGPVELAQRATAIAAESPHVACEILGPAEIAETGMGAFLSVTRGSVAEPRLIALRYDPPGARDGILLGLVGKAITFDSGGLSLKPPGRMDEMKGDMAGGAAALCGLGAIAELGVPLSVLAVVPACENMPSGTATRPGDIVTALDGTTIEVTNTDAEGRMVLADALVWVRRRGATHLVDLATLTGAVVVALGDFYAGLLGNDDAWVADVRAAAEASGDHAWPLPLHETYRRYIRSPYADRKNSSDLRQAGPIYAARFLQEFAGEGPWAHLDIAGTAFLERSRGDYYTNKGATGYGVRLLAALAERVAGAA
ncbi:MAG: leucyl aminopeptidase [Thermoleophilia bacterium]|nr:leucyl aminopeptidase [Thermoleophilia bacterium]